MGFIKVLLMSDVAGAAQSPRLLLKPARFNAQRRGWLRQKPFALDRGYSNRSSGEQHHPGQRLPNPHPAEEEALQQAGMLLRFAAENAKGCSAERNRDRLPAGGKYGAPLDPLHRWQNARRGGIWHFFLSV
jgi:hypothetical protein